MVALLFVMALQAQTVQNPKAQVAPPSFAGVWTFVRAIPALKESATALKPEPVTIRHTATTIAIDSTAFGRINTMTFTIGGAKPDANKQGAQTWSTTTKWDGASLVTTGTISQVTSAGYDEWKYTETRTLDARGHMFVDTKRVEPDGTVTTRRQEWAARGPSKGSQP